jgi:hypothetical protein
MGKMSDVYLQMQEEAGQLIYHEGFKDGLEAAARLADDHPHVAAAIRELKE